MWRISPQKFCSGRLATSLDVDQAWVDRMRASFNYAMARRRFFAMSEQRMPVFVQTIAGFIEVFGNA
jgi:hypothetical protein